MAVGASPALAFATHLILPACLAQGNAVVFNPLTRVASFCLIPQEEGGDFVCVESIPVPSEMLTIGEVGDYHFTNELWQHILDVSEEREGEVESGGETDDDEGEETGEVAVEAVVEADVQVGIEAEVGVSGVEENTAANAEVVVAGETGEILNVAEGEEEGGEEELTETGLFLLPETDVGNLCAMWLQGKTCADLDELPDEIRTNPMVKQIDCGPRLLLGRWQTEKAEEHIDKLKAMYTQRLAGSDVAKEISKR